MTGKLPNRRSLRIPDFDYSQNFAYFVTLCTYKRKPIFGNIVNATITLSAEGEILKRRWENLNTHFPYCFPDLFVIMPDHFHGIVYFSYPANRTGHRPVPTKKNASLSDVMRAFKTFSAIEMNRSSGIKASPVWQPRFYDHVIRDEDDYERVAEYILTNPLRWELEKTQRVGWLM